MAKRPMLFGPGTEVYCAAFGIGHITNVNHEGGLYVKFHGGPGQEFYYYPGGKWREVTEDTYYDLSHAPPQYAQFAMRIVDRAAWGLIGAAMTVIYIYSPWSAW